MIEITFLLKLPKSKYSPSTFHKLRVEIKKLRALLRLIQHCSPGFKYKKAYKPLQQIFRQAGKIRELQIEEAMIKKYSSVLSLKAFAGNLKKEKLIEKDAFFKLIIRGLLSRLNRKCEKLQPLLSGIKKTASMKYVQKLRRNIEKWKHVSVLKNEHIHNLRIALKEYNYNRRSLHFEHLFQSFAGEARLIRLLGERHDGQVAILHLDKAQAAGNIPAGELEAVQKLKENILLENENILHTINEVRAKIKVPVSHI